MSNLIEIETSEAEVTVAGITAEPPTITCVYSGRDARDMRRDFVQQVPMQDANLARRALSELHQGDRAQITVVNKWYEDRCDTYLTDFKLIDLKRVLDAETASVPKNGAVNIVHDERRQIILPSERDPKTKVQH